MSDFLDNLVQIIDSYDSLGAYRKFTKEQKLARAFLSTKEEKEKLLSCGQIDPKYKGQVTVFFQAAALTVEKATGKMVSSIIEINEEGFGRGILYAGRLILVSKGLRGTQQFAFTDIEKAVKEGEKTVASAIEWIQRYPDIVEA